MDDRLATQGVALTPWVLHDVRRSFVTGMSELGIAPHIGEAIVNHSTGVARRGVAGVYNKAVYAAEKRAALQRWADHLDRVRGVGEGAAVIVRLRA